MDINSREAVIQSLRGLRLMEFDWDGVGGLPLRGDVGDTVADLYEGEIGLVMDAAETLPMPIVSLNTNGTIEVAYKDPENDRRLDLTFQCLGVITYLKLFEDGQTSVEGVIRIDMLSDLSAADCEELVELFDWLASE